MRARAQRVFKQFADAGVRYLEKRPRLRDIVYTALGWLIRDTASYRRWAKARTRENEIGPLAQRSPNPVGDDTTGRLTPSRGCNSAEDAAVYRALHTRLDGLRPDARGLLSPNARSEGARAEDATRAHLPVFVKPTCPKVSIMVRSRGLAHVAVRCLGSIARAKCDVEHEVILVDDGRDAAGVTVLAGIAGLLVSEYQPGCCAPASVNRALGCSRGDFVVVLDGAVDVCDGWLDALVQFLEAEPSAGATGLRLALPEVRLQQFGMRVARDSSLRSLVDDGDTSADSRAPVCEVDMPTVGCFAMRRDLLRALGGLDESFFSLSYALADLCLRMQARELRLYCCAQGRVACRLDRSALAQGEDAPLAECVRDRQRLAERWQTEIDAANEVRVVALCESGAFPKDSDAGQTGELAQRFGIYGFCIRYPAKRACNPSSDSLAPWLDEVYPGFPFCLCLDGDTALRRAERAPHGIPPDEHEDAGLAGVATFDRCARLLGSSNYIRINGKPLLVLSGCGAFPDLRERLQHLRQRCRDRGLDEIFVALYDPPDPSWLSGDTQVCGADAAVEYDPLGLHSSVLTSNAGGEAPGDLAGSRFDDTVYRCMARALPAYRLFRLAMPLREDPGQTSASRWARGSGAGPGGYRAWLEAALEQTLDRHCGDERLVFVSGWCDDAGKARLAPDNRYGFAYLQANLDAVDRDLFEQAWVD
jgi:hypothetical protein